LRELAGPTGHVIGLVAPSIHERSRFTFGLPRWAWTGWADNPAQPGNGWSGWRTVVGRWLNSAERLHLCHTDPEVEALTCNGLVWSPTTVSTQVDRPRFGMPTTSDPGFGWQPPLERISTETATSQRTDVLEVEESFARARKGSSAIATQAQPHFAASGISDLRGPCCAATPWPPWRTWPSGTERTISHSSGSELHACRDCFRHPPLMLPRR